MEAGPVFHICIAPSLAQSDYSVMSVVTIVDFPHLGIKGRQVGGDIGPILTEEGLIASLINLELWRVHFTLFQNSLESETLVKHLAGRGPSLVGPSSSPWHLSSWSTTLGLPCSFCTSSGAEFPVIYYLISFVI